MAGGFFDLVSGNTDAAGMATNGSFIWVLDRNQDEVQKYNMTGTLISSFQLTSANSDPEGITTDGSSLWVVDENDRRVYEYDFAGASLGSFDLVSGNRDATGITTDGTTFWVLDKDDDRVYTYDSSGTSTGSFDLSSANGDARGLTKVGTEIWVVDDSDRKIYKYDSVLGTSAGNLSLVSDNGGARGITSDGTNVWVADKADRKAYKYDLAGNHISAGDFSFPTSNKDARGITTDGASYWVVDRADKRVYKYSLLGCFAGSFDLTSANSDARGIAYGSSSLWVVDRADRVVYKYDVSGTFISSFGLTSANGDARGITTDAASIWVADDSDRKAYRYDTSGTFLDSFALLSANGDARGIATDGTSIWVADDSDRKVYKYDTSGTSLGSFDFQGSNGDASGISKSGSKIWVVDQSDDVTFEYGSDGSFISALPMNETSPGGLTLFNYDTDRDSAPGLLIRQSTNGLAETDPDKFQSWRTDPLLEDLVIAEDSLVDFRSATKNFDDGNSAEVLFFLRDRDPAGAYVEIASGTIFETNWQGGVTGDFVDKILTIADPDYTVVAGHELELKVVVDSKSQSDMWFAYDTPTYASALLPSVDKLLGSAIDASLETVNAAAATGSFPVTFNATDFQPYTFVFTGDVNLNAETQVWLDPERTQLKPGVYFTDGSLTLGNAGAQGQVTFIARDIILENKGLNLTTSQGSVLLFATGSGPTGLAVKISGSDHMLNGIIYAPQGQVTIKATRVLLDGSVYSAAFDWLGSKGRISFNPDLL